MREKRLHALKCHPGPRDAGPPAAAIPAATRYVKTQPTIRETQPTSRTEEIPAELAAVLSTFVVKEERARVMLCGIPRGDSLLFRNQHILYGTVPPVACAIPPVANATTAYNNNAASGPRFLGWLQRGASVRSPPVASAKKTQGRPTARQRKPEMPKSKPARGAFVKQASPISSPISTSPFVIAISPLSFDVSRVHSFTRGVHLYFQQVHGGHSAGDMWELAFGIAQTSACQAEGTHCEGGYARERSSPHGH